MAKKTAEPSGIATTEITSATIAEQEQAEPTAAPTAAIDPAVEELKATIARMEQRQHEMTIALLNAQAATRHPEPAPEEPLYKITNVCGANVSFYVTDAKTTHPMWVYLEGRGTHKMLTKDQILELHINAPHFFADGYVSAPDIVQPSANVIPDIGAFIESLDGNDIPARIAAITSKGVLHDIHHYIENKRWRSHDENGQPFLDAQKEPEMRPIPLDMKHFAVLHAVAEQLAYKNGIQPVIIS